MTTLFWVVTRSPGQPDPMLDYSRPMPFGSPGAWLAGERLDEENERGKQQALRAVVARVDEELPSLMQMGFHPFFQRYYAHLVDLPTMGDLLQRPRVLSTVEVTLPKVKQLNDFKRPRSRGKGPQGEFPNEKGVWRGSFGDAPPWGWGKVLRSEYVNLGGFKVRRTQALNVDAEGRAIVPAARRDASQPGEQDDVRENPPPLFGPGDRVRRPAGIVEEVWYSGIPGDDWLARIITARGPVTVPACEVLP